MTELHTVIMNKEDFTFSEADDLIQEMRDQVKEGFLAEYILYEYGYDADYVFDLIM